MDYPIGMAHEIETTNGQARMAYSGPSVPWHKLGTSVRGLQTIPEMLRAANADFDVVTADVAAVDAHGRFILNADGTPVIVPKTRATIRVNDDGSFDGLGTVGTRYVVQQNREVLELALAVCGVSKGQAVLDTCGVLNGGQEFFATIDLGQVVIDPNGLKDVVKQYIVVHNGHDGKTPISFANTPIRAVCKNTVFAAMQSSAKVSARHTKNADLIVTNAREVLQLSSQSSNSILNSATKLSKIEIPNRSNAFMSAVNNVFIQNKNETKLQQKNRENIIDEIITLYSAPNNAGGYGYTGWSLYNTIAEYLDHHRNATAQEKAMASMDAYSWVNKKKSLAHEVILSLAN